MQTTNFRVKRFRQNLVLPTKMMLLFIVSVKAQSQNVGIGTSNPAAKLHVVSGSSTGILASSGSTLILDKGSGSNHLSLLVDANAEAALVFGRKNSLQPPFDGGIYYNNNGLGAMEFRNNGGLTRMTIHDDGNISIGNLGNVSRFYVALTNPSILIPFNNSSLVLDGGNASHYINMLSHSGEQGLLFGTNFSNRDGGIFYAPTERALTFRTGNLSNRMVIDGSGRVGIGTATPAFRMHVVTDDAQNFGFRQGIMVENTAQDVGATINTGEAAISFKNAGANGTGSNQWMLGLNQNRNFAFAYGSDFAAGSITKMLLDSTGNLGIGTTAPSQKLHVVGNILATGTVTPSDVRYKKNFSSISNILPLLMAVHPMYYQYNKEAFPEMGFDDCKTLGFMAQELEQLFPELVVTDYKGYKSVDYSKMSVLLLRGLQEQQQQIAQQDSDTEQMQQRIKAMEAKLITLENAIKKN